jgi:GNAT superfamily N-acetyltransferase
MEARLATPEDADEIVRLARVMFESMGIDLDDPAWEREGCRHVRERIGGDLAIFVVDHPSAARLIAAAAGTIAQRLPTPLNVGGRVGYVQWVCTDPEHRRRGLARQVMTSLLSWYEANDVPAVELHATPDAEGLYLSMGFNASGGRALRPPAGLTCAPVMPARPGWRRARGTDERDMPRRTSPRARPRWPALRWWGPRGELDARGGCAPDDRHAEANVQGKHSGTASGRS